MLGGNDIGVEFVRCKTSRRLEEANNVFLANNVGESDFMTKSLAACFKTITGV